MLSRPFSPSLSSVALAVMIACLPASAFAQAAPPTHTYYTTLTAFVGSAFPDAGSLKLRFMPDGSVHGTYTPQDDAATFSPVVGQVHGEKIWFDINGSGRVHVNATIRSDGSIHGAAIRGDSNASYVFVATPN